ncbi:MAG: TIGR02611 family protein [Solirubrobacteraceae bacterium]
MLAGIRGSVKSLRSWVYKRPGGPQAWRGGIAFVGLVVIIVGIVLLAVPGPGWLVIFAGLGIWATEFAWAKSLLGFVRRTVGVWTAWLRRQPRWLAVVVGAAGLLVLAAVAAGAWVLVR